MTDKLINFWHNIGVFVLVVPLSFLLDVSGVKWILILRNI